MCAQPLERKPKSTATLDKLIDEEWDIYYDLKNKLNNPELSMPEQIRMANALAYHSSVLSRLLNQKGEGSRFDDVTLGEFVKNVDARVYRIVRREFKFWTKKRSSKK